MRKIALTILASLVMASSAFAFQATVTWTDSSNETGYRITRSDNGGAFVAQATLAANITSFNQNTGLVLDTAYCYQVIAFNALGDAAQPWPQICGTPAAPVNAGGLSLVFQP